MAIKKREALRLNSPKDLLAMFRFELKIDQELQERYSPGGLVSLDLAPCSHSIVDVLAARYKAAGWGVEVNSYGHDQYHIVLS